MCLMKMVRSLCLSTKCPRRCHLAITTAIISTAALCIFILGYQMDKHNFKLLNRKRVNWSTTSLPLTNQCSGYANTSLYGLEDGFHVITTFFDFSDPEYNKRLDIENEHQLVMRQQEVDECLRRNLLNPLVKSITILYNLTSVPDYICKLDIEGKEKIVLHNSVTEPTVKVLYRYVNSFLTKRVVILMHMDNILGPGVEKIDRDRMLREDIVYALTRRLEEGATCEAVRTVAHCDMDYVGSHDAFIFSLKKKYDTQDIFNHFEFEQHSFGQENIQIWWFDKIMKFKVSNPCKVIAIYHHHCIALRNKGRKRYDSNGKSGKSPYVTTL